MKVSLTKSFIFTILVILVAAERRSGSSDVSEQVTKDPLRVDRISSNLTSNNSYVMSSTEGGMTVYVFGQGFDGTASNNKVSFGPYPCTVIGSSNQLITCVTTKYYAIASSTVTQQELLTMVTVNGKTAKCFGYCNFQYNQYSTPTTEQLEPRAIVGGENVTFWGVHRAQNLSQIKYFKIGQNMCIPINRTKEDTNNTNTTSRDVNSSTASGTEKNSGNNRTVYYPWGYSLLDCTSDIYQAGGLYNVTELTAIGYTAKKNSYVYSVRERKSFEIMVVPTISNLSESSGSSEAHFLNIKGTGFGLDKNNVNVEVAGTACAVTALTSNELNCVAKPSTSTATNKANQGRIATNSTLPQQGGYISGSGMKFTKWGNLSAIQEKTWQGVMTAMASNTIKLMESGSMTQLSVNSTEPSVLYHIKGYFRPLASGVHRFLGLTNGRLAMFISSVKGSSNMLHMNYSDPILFYNNTYKNIPQSDVNLNELPQNLTSRPLNMTAGEYYYIEVGFITNNFNDSVMQIQLRTPNDDPDAPGMMPEIQDIEVRPVIDPDISKFIQTGANNGTMHINIQMRYSWYNQPYYNQTANFTWNATAEEFLQAARALVSEQYQMSVTRQVFDMYDADPAVSGLPPYKYVWTVTIPKYRQQIYNSSQEINVTLINNLQNLNDSTIIPTFNQQNIQMHSPPLEGSYLIALNGFGVTWNTNSSSVIPLDPSYFKINLWTMPYYLGQYMKYSWNCKFIKIYEKEKFMPRDGLHFTVAMSGCQGLPTTMPLIQIDTSGLTGGRNGTTPTATVTRIQAMSNDLILNPITSEFLFSPADQPQVTLNVNGIVSSCRGNCTFNYTTSVPIVNSASYTPTTAKLTVTLSYPTAITLKTTDFTIFLDEANCSKTTGNQNSLVCMMPTNPDGTARVRAGNHLPMVVINKVGAAKLATTVTAISIPLTLTSYSPTTKLGKAGGQYVLIKGAGFPFEVSDALNVTICGTRVLVTSVNNTMINATLPPCSTDATIINVSFDTKTASLNFNYDPTVVPPIISTILPTSASPVLKGSMKITGSGFGIDRTILSAWLTQSGQKKYQLNIIKANDTELTVKLPGGLPGDFQVVVIRNGYGVSTPSATGVNNFKYEIVITGVSPTVGSAAGGTVLTITGRNFSPDPSENQVYVGNAMNWFCEIVTASATQLTCITPPLNQFYTTLSQPVAVVGRITVEATCQGTCTFTYDNATYPTVTAPATTIYNAGQNITLTGTKFSPGGSAPTIKVGDIDVVPTGFSDTQLNFTYPALPEGEHKLKIYVQNDGYAMPYISTFTYTSSGSLSPSAGSTEGNIFTITGNALVPSTNDTFLLEVVKASTSPQEFVPYQIIEDTPTKLKFRILSLGQAAQSLTVRYGYNSYTYASYDAETPIINIRNGNTITFDPTIVHLGFDRPNTTLQVDKVSAFPIDANGDKFGDEIQLPILSINTAAVNFTVDSSKLSAGKWRFLVFCPMHGYAKMSSDLTINYLTPPTAASVVSSYAGGNLLTVVGNGLNNNSRLLIDGDAAELASYSSTELKYTIPPYSPLMSTNRYNLGKRTEAKGKVFADNSLKLHNINDNKLSTVYESTNTNCFIGWDLGDKYKKNLFKILYHINKKAVEPSTLVGGKFEGSTDNITYTVIAQIQANVTKGWNQWRTSQPLPTIYRYIRFSHNSTSSCRISQVRLFDGIFSVPTTVTSFKVDAEFSNGINVETWTQKVDYRLNATPNVTAVNKLTVSPKGGETLQITGLNFGTVMANVAVVIDGISCAVTSVTNTNIACTTGAKPTVTPLTGFDVKVDGRRSIVMTRNVTYAFRWSDPDTWSGDFPPILDDAVYVPAGMTLLVDQSTPKLKIIIVEGTLAFADEKQYSVQTEFIMLNYGRLQIGTEDYPYQNKLNITLHGGYYDRQLPIFGNKAIGCHACVFDIHGKFRNKTWTELGQTVLPGSTTVKLAEAVDWQVGESFFVASTNFDYNEAERRIISSIDTTKTLITVEDPFVFTHLSQSESVNGVILNVKAEVGLLTRNVLITGTQDSLGSNHGAHVLLHGSSEEGLIGRIEYAQFALCGQPRIIDRHCLLFQQNGGLEDSYVRGNSFHDSVSSLIVLQSSSGLAITNNVGFRSQSHGIFLETGSEMGNLVENNLIASTMASSYVLEQPTSFLLKNPNNIVRGNRAAGSQAYGIQYLLPERAEGIDGDKEICPSGTFLNELHHNIIHSNRRTGLRIETLISRMKPCEPIMDPVLPDPWSNNPPINNTIHSMQFYKNIDKAMLLQDIGQTLLTNLTIFDIGSYGLILLYTDYQPGNVVLSASSITGKTVMNGQTTSAVPNGMGMSIGLGTPSSPNFHVKDVKISNFPQGSAVFSPFLSIYTPDPQFPKSDYVMTYFSNISFTGISGSHVQWTGFQRELYEDLDGSLARSYFNGNLNTTFNRSTLFQFQPHSVSLPNCLGSSTTWPNTVICDRAIRPHVYFISNALPDHYMYSPMIELVNSTTNESLSNYTYLWWTKTINTGVNWVAVYLPGRTYRVTLANGWNWMSLDIPIPKYISESESAVIMRFKYTDSRQLYEIATVDHLGVSSALITQSTDPLDPTVCLAGDFYQSHPGTYVDVCVTNRMPSGSTASSGTKIVVNGIRCRNFCPKPIPIPDNNDTNNGGGGNIDNFVKEDFMRVWSNTTQWPRGELPTAGENVTIPGEWNLLVDMDPAAINYFEIRGDVYIDERDTVISAKSIWLRAGSLRAGNSTNPFGYKLTIYINGSDADMNWAINQGHSGKKYFLVTGKLFLYGPIPSNTHNRLKAKAQAGDTSIEVENVADWLVGDTIALSPSFSNSTQYEKAVISNIAGNIVTLDRALIHTYFGEVGPTLTGSTALDMRTIVMLLSRNISIIRGEDGDLGFRTDIFSFNDGNVSRHGQAILKGVAFWEGGQQNSNNAALSFQGTIGTDKNSSVEGCSFWNCHSYCLILSFTKLDINNNLFVGGNPHIVTATSQDYNFTNNVMVGASSRVTSSIACFAHLRGVSFTTSKIVVTENICAGSVGAGFIIPYEPCDLEPTNTTFRSNTASGCQAGFMYLVHEAANCLQAKRVNAYNCKVGILGNPTNTSSLKYDQLTLVDNYVGLSLRHGQGPNTDNNTAYVNNSYFAGVSRPSCTYCYGNSATYCTNTTAIRLLATSQIGTPFYINQDNLNMDAVTITNKFAPLDSKTFVFGSVFVNFGQSFTGLSDCSSVVVFRRNPDSLENIGSTYIFNSTCTNCTNEGRAYFQPPPPATETNLGCGEISCTGPNNYIIQDQTGEFLGTAGTMIANNSKIGNGQSNCLAIPTTNAHICTRTDFAILQYESVAKDYNTRLVWPIELFYTGGNWNTTTNAWREWEWSGTEPANKRMARFISTIVLNQTYNMTFATQPPSDLKFQLQKRTMEGNSFEWAVFYIYYPIANFISVSVAGQIVQPQLATDTNELSTQFDVCGANRYYYTNGTIGFVLNGKTGCQVKLSVTNNVQISAKLQTTVSEFYANGGVTKFVDRMCAYLNITTDRLKVVGVFAGSVVIDSYVIDSISASGGSPANSTAQQQSQSHGELSQISQMVQQAATSSLNLQDLGAIISATTVVNVVNTDGTTYVPPTVVLSDSTKSIALIVGVAFAAMVVLIGTIVGVIFLIKKCNATKIGRQMIEPEKEIDVAIPDYANSSGINIVDGTASNSAFQDATRRKMRIRQAI